MVDVSVIIVTWNSAKVFKRCIDSVISNASNLSVEVIVIDNHSADDTFKIENSVQYKNYHSYQNAENFGYTKAVNQGIRYSTGRNVFLLNPDTILEGDKVISELSAFLDSNESYAACAPLMLNEDKSIQQSVRSFPDYWTMFCEFSLLAHIFFKTKLFGKWRMKFYKYDKDDDVNQPMAAALMIKRKWLDVHEAMDEVFYMFFNDVDICKRIIYSGNKIRLLTGNKVTHSKGDSIYKDRVRMIKAWNKDCMIYFRKHHNNALLLLWLRINLYVTGFFRILYYKIS